MPWKPLQTVEESLRGGFHSFPDCRRQRLRFSACLNTPGKCIQSFIWRTRASNTHLNKSTPGGLFEEMGFYGNCLSISCKMVERHKLNVRERRSDKSSLKIAYSVSFIRAMEKPKQPSSCNKRNKCPISRCFKWEQCLITVSMILKLKEANRFIKTWDQKAEHFSKPLCCWMLHFMFGYI